MQEVEDGSKFPHGPKIPPRHLRRLRWLDKRSNDFTRTPSTALPLNIIVSVLILLLLLSIVFLLHLLLLSMLPFILLLRRPELSLRRLLLLKPLLHPHSAGARRPRPPERCGLLRGNLGIVGGRAVVAGVRDDEIGGGTH